MIVHAGGGAGFTVLGHGGGGHRDNRQLGVFGARAQPARGFKAVHDRHVQVHQNRVETVVLQEIERLLSVAGDGDGKPAFAEKFLRHLLVEFVVLDEQDARAANAGQRNARRVEHLAEQGRAYALAVLYLDQRVEKVGRGDRLGEDGVDALFVRFLEQFGAPVGRDHDDRRRACSRLAIGGGSSAVLDGARRIEPAHAGHAPVEQQELEGLAAGSGVLESAQCRFARICLAHGEAPAFEDGAEDGERSLLVVDDQRAHRPQIKETAGRRIDERAGGQSKACREGECAAAPRFARQVDLSAHQFDQAFADRQAQPGAAEAPGDAGVGLDEGLEEARGLFLADTDAGVAHRNAQQHFGLALFDAIDADGDVARFGELDRVGDQVADDLAEA